MPGYYKKDPTTGKPIWIETGVDANKEQPTPPHPQSKTINNDIDPTATPIQTSPSDRQDQNEKFATVAITATKLLSQPPLTTLSDNILATVQDILTTAQDPAKISELFGNQIYEIIMSPDIERALWEIAIDLAYELNDNPAPPIYITPQVY